MSWKKTSEAKTSKELSELSDYIVAGNSALKDTVSEDAKDTPLIRLYIL